MNVCTHPSCADGCFYVFKGCVIVAYISLDSVGSGLDGIKSAENSVGKCSDGIWYENPFVRTASRGIRASEQRLSGQTGLDFFGENLVLDFTKCNFANSVLDCPKQTIAWIPFTKQQISHSIPAVAYPLLIIQFPSHLHIPRLQISSRFQLHG